MRIEFKTRFDYFNKTQVVGYAARFDSAADAYRVTCVLIGRGIPCTPTLDYAVYVPMKTKAQASKQAEFLALCAGQGFTIVGGAA